MLATGATVVYASDWKRPLVFFLESNIMYFINNDFEYEVNVFQVVEEDDKILYGKTFGLERCNLFLRVAYTNLETKDKKSIGIRAIKNREVIWTEEDMSEKISQKGFCKCKQHIYAVDYINKLVKNLAFA